MSEVIKSIGIIVLGIFLMTVIIISNDRRDEHVKEVVELNHIIDSLKLINDILVSPRPLITEAFHLKCYWLPKED